MKEILTHTFIGLIYGKYRVYCNKRQTNDNIIIGYMECGGEKGVKFIVGKGNDLNFYEERILNCKIINKRFTFETK